MSDAITSVAPAESVVEAIERVRGERYEARRFLWRHSHNEAVSRCGRLVRGSAVGVKVSTDVDGKRDAGLANLEHCGSVWGCPVCSARILQQRSLMIAELCRRHDAAGGKIVLLTLTVAHGRRDPLAQIWDTVGKCWSGSISGSEWIADQEEFGWVETDKGTRIPWLRIFDLTHGINGWHPHVHALLFVNSEFTQSDATALGIRMWHRWNRVAVKRGLKPGVLRGDDGQLVGVTAELFKGDPSKALGDYFSKAVFELTGSRFKVGKEAGQHRTPWQLLADLVAHRNRTRKLSDGQRRRTLALWYEYEAASYGRRLMGMSKGLLALFGMEGWAPTDQEIVDQELSGDVVYLIGLPTWAWICRQGLDYAVIAAFRRGQREGEHVVEAIAARWEPVSPPGGDRGGGGLRRRQRIDPDTGEVLVELVDEKRVTIPRYRRAKKPAKPLGPLTERESRARDLLGI